jgi:hypothetical protein
MEAYPLDAHPNFQRRHEGHEGFGLFSCETFLSFVIFVVRIVLSLWL